MSKKLIYNGEDKFKKRVAEILENGGISSASKLAELQDVTISDPQENQVLKYNGSDWVNDEVDVSITSALSDMTDVNIQNPSDSQILKYDSASGKWINTANEGTTTEVALISIMTSATTPLGIASASNSHPSYGAPWKAFNDTNIDAQDGWVTYDNHITEWIQYQFEDKQIANKLYIENRMDGSDSVCRPVKDFELFGGNTESSLNLLGTFTNTKVNRREGTYYTFDNKIPYLIYRIKVLSTNDPENKHVGFGKIQLYNVNNRSGSVYTAGDGIDITDDNIISTSTRLIDITQVDYDNLSLQEQNDPSVYYNITDGIGEVVTYEMPFRFGIDKDNNYGYFKDDEFILLPGQTAEYKWFENGQLYNTDIFGYPVFRTNSNGINNASSYEEDGYIKLTCTNNDPRGSGVESIVYTEYQIPTKYNRVKVSFILHSTRGQDYLDFRFGIHNSNGGLVSKNSALIYSPSFTASEQLQEYELTIGGSVSGYLFIGCCAVADIYSVTFYSIT